MLEVGCGTGATIYPYVAFSAPDLTTFADLAFPLSLLERYPRARFVAFDFAKKCVAHWPSS